MAWAAPTMADARQRALRRRAAVPEEMALDAGVAPEMFAARGYGRPVAAPVAAPEMMDDGEGLRRLAELSRRMDTQVAPEAAPQPTGLDRLRFAAQWQPGLGPERPQEIPAAEAAGLAWRGPGVYEVADAPGMVDVVIDGETTRMSEDELYSGPRAAEMTGAVREAIARQSPPLEVAMGEPVEAPLEVEIGQPVEMRASAGNEQALSPAQQERLLAAVREGRQITAPLAEGPLLARSEASRDDGVRDGVVGELGRLIPGAALSPDTAHVTLTPEAFQALMTLTGDEQLQVLGEQVGGRAKERRAAAARSAELDVQRGLEKRRLDIQEAELGERRKERQAARAQAEADRQLRRDELNDAKEARAAAKATADAAKADVALERDVQKLGKDTEGTAQLVQDVKYLESLAENPGEIPGFGLWDSIKPGVAQEPGDIEARQAAMRVAAELLHQISGAAVTPSEAERFMEGRGIGPGYTEAQAKAGIRGLVRDLRAKLSAQVAKYRPEVVERLRARGGVLPEALDGKAAPRSAVPTSQGAPLQSGEVEIRDPEDGEVRYVPEDQLQIYLEGGWEEVS